MFNFYYKCYVQSVFLRCFRILPSFFIKVHFFTRVSIFFQFLTAFYAKTDDVVDHKLFLFDNFYDNGK